MMVIQDEKTKKIIKYLNLVRYILKKINPELIQFIEYVTIIGVLEPETSIDGMKLSKLMYKFRDVVKLMVHELYKGKKTEELVKLGSRPYQIIPDCYYLDSAIKKAKLILEGTLKNQGNPMKIKIRKIFLDSRGNKSDYGNRNVKLEMFNNYVQVLIKYPWDGTWIRCKAYFGRKYLPLIKELIELAKRKEEGYGVQICLKERNGKSRLEIHLNIPTWLYLKYFMKYDPVVLTLDELREYVKNYVVSIRGIDLNSDRINSVRVDDDIENPQDILNFHFHEVSSHGFPKEKAWYLRLSRSNVVVRYAREEGCIGISLEDLTKIKKRKFTSNPNANRKISRFPKRKWLQYIMIQCLKHGLLIIPVDPKGTTHSQEHDEVMKKFGLDKHTASAYLIAKRGLEKLKQII